MFFEQNRDEEGQRGNLGAEQRWSRTSPRQRKKRNRGKGQAERGDAMVVCGGGKVGDGGEREGNGEGMRVRAREGKRDARE